MTTSNEKQNEKQEEKIECLENKIVGWKVFIWAISVIIILFGIAFTSIATLSNKIDGVQTQYIEIKTQLAQIQTDLVWLKEAMSHDTQ